MACTISVSLLSEHVDGNIGDDWQYSLEVEVFNPESTGTGRLEVENHKLTPGVTQVPANQRTIVIPAGHCDATAAVKLTLTAAEVDLVFSDSNESTSEISVRCPGEGSRPLTFEREVSVHVEEKPRILGGAATLIVKVSLVAACE